MQNAEGKEALGKSASCEYTGEDEMKIVVTVQIDRRLSAPEPLQMEKYMLDKDIREPLFDFLEEFYGKIRIFEEKGDRNFAHGCARRDRRAADRV